MNKRLAALALIVLCVAAMRPDKGAETLIRLAKQTAPKTMTDAARAKADALMLVRSNSVPVTTGIIPSLPALVVRSNRVPALPITNFVFTWTIGNGDFWRDIPMSGLTNRKYFMTWLVGSTNGGLSFDVQVSPPQRIATSNGVLVLNTNASMLLRSVYNPEFSK